MTTLRNYELMLNGEVYVGRMETPSQQLRCVFDIIASPGDAFATMDLRLYNQYATSSPRPDGPPWSETVQPNKTYNKPPPANIGLSPQPGLAIQFLAGYTQFTRTVSPDSGIVTVDVKDEIATLFTGTITNVFRERDGANIVTRILCRSGDNVDDTGVANASYSQGVTLYDVLVDLASSWGKRLVADKEKCQTIVMVSGYVTDGDITREMSILANSYNFKWTNFNGQLSVTFPSDTRTSAKHLISQTTGMIGMPEISGGSEGVFVDVGVRLNPFMGINDQIEIDAQYQTFNTGNAFVTHVESFASGLWNILALRYRGDNWGGQWRVDVNGIRSGVAAETTLDVGSKLVWGAKVNQAFRAKVREIGKRQNIDPNWLMATMAFETGNSFLPYEKNSGSGATGLIQFTKSTATSLGTSTTKLARMSAVEQLDWVEKYFEPYRGKIHNLGDTYMAVFAPIGIGKSDSTVLYTSPSVAYNQNAGLDKQRKGYITRGDCIVRVNAAFKTGQQYAAG